MKKFKKSKLSLKHYLKVKIKQILRLMLKEKVNRIIFDNLLYSTFDLKL